MVLLDAAFYWPGISQGLVDTVPRVTFCSLWCLVKVGVSYVFFTGAVWFTMIPPELGSAPYGLQLKMGDGKAARLVGLPNFRTTDWLLLRQSLPQPNRANPERKFMEPIGLLLSLDLDQTFLSQICHQGDDFGFDSVEIGVKLGLNDLCDIFHSTCPIYAFPDSCAHCVQAIVAAAGEVDDQGFVVNRAGDDLARILGCHRIWNKMRHILLKTAEGLMTSEIIAQAFLICQDESRQLIGSFRDW